MTIAGRCAGVIGVMALVISTGLLAPPVAHAIAPPIVDPGPPPTGPVAPLDPTEL